MTIERNCTMRSRGIQTPLTLALGMLSRLEQQRQRSHDPRPRPAPRSLRFQSSGEAEAAFSGRKHKQLIFYNTYGC